MEVMIYGNKIVVLQKFLMEGVDVPTIASRINSSCIEIYTLKEES